MIDRDDGVILPSVGVPMAGNGQSFGRSGHGVAAPGRPTGHQVAGPNGQLSVLSSIGNIREVTGRCLAGEPLGQDLAEWLGTALQGFLNRQYRTVEEALGLYFPQGGVPWWREEAIRKRDGALRDLADSFFGELSPCAQAHRIWTDATRYAASAWRIDRDLAGMPDRYLGTIKEYLWLAFSSGATMPIGDRQLRNILAR